MREIADIDIMGDDLLARRMTWVSLAMLAIGLAAGVLAWALGAGETVGAGWFVILLLVTLSSLAVHEVVHAIAFKALGGADVRVSFGFAQGMLYTSAAGAVLARPRFVAVLLAPAATLSVLLPVGCSLIGLPLMGWMAFAVHLSGCVGDFAMVCEIRRTPGCTHVRDTERGITLLGE